jgi:predicted metal-dependent phosphoesterase TrpH
VTADLHLHTTASDGRCSPSELVERASAARLAVIAVTDHDTTASVGAVRTAAALCDIEVVAGIEITAVDAGRDVHILGYFIDPDAAGLGEFLTRARADRIARVEAIGARLAAIGRPIDVAAIVGDARTHGGRSIGRPQVARAMIAAGYAADMQDAFDHWLGNDGPVYVPRTGSSPEQVIAVVHAAGGLASLAHPGRTKIDARIAALRDAGLDALEVFHSGHDEAQVTHYGAVADAFGLLVTGGSDFHGDPTHGLQPGSAGLPEPEWARLRAARHRHAAR